MGRGEMLLDNARDASGRLREGTRRFLRVRDQRDALKARVEEGKKRKGGEKKDTDTSRRLNELEQRLGRERGLLQQEIAQAKSTLGALRNRRRRSLHQASEARRAWREARIAHGSEQAEAAISALERDAQRYARSHDRLESSVDMATQALREKVLIHISRPKNKFWGALWSVATFVLGLIVPPIYSLHLGAFSINLGITGLSIGLFEIGGWSLGLGIPIGPRSKRRKKRRRWSVDVSPATSITPPIVIY